MELRLYISNHVVTYAIVFTILMTVGSTAKAMNYDITPIISLLLFSDTDTDAPDTCGDVKSLVIFPGTKNVPGSLEKEDDIDFYKIKNPNFYTNTITFSFPTNFDLRAFLIDENCVRQLASNDDEDESAGKYNFSFEYQLEPGKTYYLKVEAYPTFPKLIGNYQINIIVEDGVEYLSALYGTPSNRNRELLTGTDTPYSPEVGSAKYVNDRGKPYLSVDQSYYASVDPDGERNTLEKWLKLHGFVNSFGQENTEVIKAEYINAFDLGLGRKMNCLKQSQVADYSFPCYVDNHFIGSNPNVPTDNPEFFASVAMERVQWFSSFGSRGFYTAFYAYDKNGQRVNSVDLDGSGPKRIPEVCWSCHDGHKSTTAGYNPTGMYFGQYLPFDINLFTTYPGALAPRLQAGINRLNAFIRDVADYEYRFAGSHLTGKYRHNAIRELINYGFNRTAKGIKGGPTNPAHGNGSSRAKFYAEYCRTCHVAQFKPFTFSSSSYTEDNCGVCHGTDDDTVFGKRVSNLNNLKRVICGSTDMIMPNAKVTHQRFLEDPQNLLASMLQESGIGSTDIFCSPDKLSKIR